MTDTLSDALPARPAVTRSAGRLPFALAAVLSRLEHLEAGRLTVSLPDGSERVFAGCAAGSEAHLAIRDLAFAKRLSGGQIGFAEGYIAGEWDTPDLPALLRLMGENQALIARFGASPVLRLVQMVGHWLNRNSKRGSKRNIHAHYDLGNEFYRHWLDATMTYSAGLGVGDGDLAAAQKRKYAAIAAAAGIKQGDHVLEIGCGWGGFAEYAARERGCRVTCVTISAEQLAHCRARFAEAGLAERIEVRFEDYRDIAGEFDAIVSIEMFEAVGEAYWPGFFETLSARLKPGRSAALQVITIDEALFPRYRREMDFIRHFIFPGGMLPTGERLKSLGRAAGFAIGDTLAFGRDYAETCRLWAEKFAAAWPEIAKLGFDERFRRLWQFYLAYCEAGFRAGTIDVCQIAYVKPVAAAG